MIGARQAEVLTALADLADTHADTPQAARTYGQVAVPSSFGAWVATWGQPLLRSHRAMPALRQEALAVSLSGAAGTGAMLGPDPAAIRAGLAEALGLPDPGTSWHAERSRIRTLATWLSEVLTATGKIGEDMLRLSRTEVGEIRFGAAGASSTMPQKQNPVAASTLVALSRFGTTQAGLITGTLHGDARDGAAWFTEWLALPQLVIACAKSLAILQDTLSQLDVRTEVMAARINDPLGLIHAETLSFALAAHMPRADGAGRRLRRLTIKAKKRRHPPARADRGGTSRGADARAVPCVALGSSAAGGTRVCGGGARHLGQSVN